MVDNTEYRPHTIELLVCTPYLHNSTKYAILKVICHTSGNLLQTTAAGWLARGQFHHSIPRWAESRYRWAILQVLHTECVHVSPLNSVLHTTQYVLHSMYARASRNCSTRMILWILHSVLVINSRSLAPGPSKSKTSPGSVLHGVDRLGLNFISCTTRFHCLCGQLTAALEK